MPEDINSIADKQKKINNKKSEPQPCQRTSQLIVAVSTHHKSGDSVPESATSAVIAHFFPPGICPYFFV